MNLLLCPMSIHLDLWYFNSMRDSSHSWKSYKLEDWIDKGIGWLTPSEATQALESLLIPGYRNKAHRGNNASSWWNHCMMESLHEGMIVLWMTCSACLLSAPICWRSGFIVFLLLGSLYEIFLARFSPRPSRGFLRPLLGAPMGPKKAPLVLWDPFLVPVFQLRR